MILVIDSNIWISQLALNTNLGSAVRFYVNQQGIRIGLPEVVELETKVHLRKRLNEFIVAVEKNHRQLLSLFGELKEVVVPDQGAVNNLVDSIFNRTGVELLRIPFDADSAYASMVRTINRVVELHPKLTH